MIRYSVLVLIGSLGFVACGGATTTPPASPEPISEPAPEEVPTAKEPEVEAEPTPEPVPEAEAPQAPSIQLITATASGRPIVQYVGAEGITTTLGQNGGILKVGEATLRIPDGALREGMNVTFSVTKTKGPADAIGTVYKIAPNVISVGSSFQIALPVPADASARSFAIELQSPDEKGRKTKPSWEHIAPTKIFTDREPNLALLELTGLFDGHVTLSTTAPPETPAP